MRGFFSDKDLEVKGQVHSVRASCSVCGLYKDAISPKMEPYGNFKKKIMVVGEAPGKSEDTKGIPWQGEAGRLLEDTLSDLGIDLFEDCVCLNSINCRPKNNRTPKENEVRCCYKEKVQPALNDYDPHLIIVLGGPAVVSIIGQRWKKDLQGISRWRGWLIPDRELNAWVCPTFHPAYVLRSDAREVYTIWKNDLKKIVDQVNQPLPRYKNPQITILEDLSPLDDIREGIIAFDYETTGLKPQLLEHKIICASVAYSKNRAYSFFMPETERERRPFVDLLKRPTVYKIAANMKFEENWSVIKLGTSVASLEWDTMQAAHILDNRPRVSSVKFQAYVRLGIIDYASTITPYLESEEDSGNGFNTIHKLLETVMGRHDLLHYCAYDSLYEYKIGVQQMNELNYEILPF